MATLYMAPSGAGGAAAPAVIATGTAIKTILQIAPSATRPIKVVAWGISFNASAAGAPAVCELVDTGTVAATVTAHTTATVDPYDDPNAPNTTVTLSTTGTGYNATAEGTVTAVRYGDLQQIPVTGGYAYQFPLGREFQVAVSRILRVRVTTAATVGCLAYVVYEE